MRKTATILCFIMLLSSLAGIAFAKEFRGVVQAMPEKGYVGQWKIDDKIVNVTEETKIEEEHGKIAVGSYVKVEGLTFEGKFVASEIETKERK